GGVVIPRPAPPEVDVVEAPPVSRRPIARMSDITQIETGESDEDELVPMSVRALVEVREALSERERDLAVLTDTPHHPNRELQLLRSRPPAPRPSEPRFEGLAPSAVDKTRTLFLAESLDQSLVQGFRTHADLVQQFPPAQVMQALERHPAVRA